MPEPAPQRRPLAGRRSELASVEDVLAGRGAAQVLLVTGEAGIGKTRLVTAASEATRHDGVLVFWAACLPLTEAEPLLPVADLLRRVYDVDAGRWLHDAAARCPGYVPATLAALLPELADPAQAPSGDGLWRQRLFAAVRHVLAELARSRPFALVLEDAHWSDSSTLDLLDHLLHAGDALPHPLVVTFRSEDADVSDVNMRWLARARRSARVAVLALDRLTAAETFEQVELVSGSADPAVVAQVFARSEGNPLFTEQLLGTGGVVPVDLRSLFDAKLRELGRGELAVLNALAVVGRPLPAASLGQLLDADVELDASLRALRAARLVRSDTDVVALRHALLAEAVLADLPVAETGRLSRRVAEAMPAWGEHGSVSETAEHWQRAGEARQELQWRIRAAEAAYAAHANREAVHHWLRVIAVWDDVPDAEELAGRPLYDVYLTADWAVFDAGMSALTVQLAAEAIARFPDAPLHVRAMLLRRQARSTAWLDFDAALPLLEQALALFEGGPPVPEWVYALSDIADARRGFGRYEEALGAGRKGVEIASVCEVSLVRRMHLACALAQHALGDEDGVEQSLAALRHAPEPDTLRERSIVAMRQVWLLIAMGRYAEVAPAGQEVLQMLAQFGASGSRLATMLRSSVAEALLVLGDVAAAAAPEVLGAVNDDDQPHLTDVEQGELILLAGDSDRAEAYFVELAGRWPGIPDWTPYLHSARAEVAAWRDDPAQALAHAAAGLASAIDNDYLHVSGILLTQAARAAGDLGRDADDAEQERLLGELDRLRAELQVDDPLAGSTRQAGAAVATWDAERARLAGADDEQAWLAAASAWQQMGARFRAGYCQWRRAETLLAHRAKRVETVEVLRAALDLAQDHVPLSRAIEATAARARIALPDGGVTPPEPVRRDFGLTERELAVLKLVGAGQTNAQIGAQLYMSPKTASVHVTNILRKLGVATRTHAAAVAERAGLLD